MDPWSWELKENQISVLRRVGGAWARSNEQIVYVSYPVLLPFLPSSLHHSMYIMMECTVSSMKYTYPWIFNWLDTHVHSSTTHNSITNALCLCYIKLSPFIHVFKEFSLCISNISLMQKHK